MPSSLRRDSGFTVAVVLTLGLVVGAATAVFAIVDAVLLTPAAVDNPSALTVAWASDPPRNLSVVEYSFANVADLAERSRSFTHVAAMGSSTWPAVLAAPGTPSRIAECGVTSEFFETVGARPALGRAFQPDDDAPNAPRVVVLSEALWTSRFGADRSAVGSDITINDTRFTVVGVMPRRFDFPTGTDVWTPVAPILAASSVGWRTDALTNVGVLFLVGRRAPGVSVEQARNEIDALSGTLAGEGRPRFGSSTVAVSFADFTLGPARYATWTLLCAAGLLLLVAGANLSSLAHGRAIKRARERAIRRALGASSARIARDETAEIMMLAGMAAVVGLAIARAILRVMVASAPAGVPHLADARLDPRAIVAGSLAAAAVALIAAIRVNSRGESGIASVLAATSPGAGIRARGWRSAFVTLQVAAATMLLVGAGLVLKSAVKLDHIALGFAPRGVLTFNVNPRMTVRPFNELVDELLQRLREMPTVQSAGAVYLRPLVLGAVGQDSWVGLEGDADPSASVRLHPTLNYQAASAGYFEAMRISVQRGRAFGPGDSPRSSRVAIVSASTAAALWQGRDPIGRRILMPAFAPGDEPAWRTVVGVVADVKYRGLSDGRLDVYDAALQTASRTADVTVRVIGDPAVAAAPIETAVRALYPDAVLSGLTTMDAVVDRATAPWRFGAWLLVVFAVTATALAMTGLFSLLALDVASRGREFAIRLAIGANSGRLQRDVFLSFGRRAVLGAVAGLGASAICLRVLQSFLFEVSAVDPVVYALAGGIVFLTASAATYMPARSAISTTPAALLRRQ